MTDEEYLENQVKIWQSSPKFEVGKIKFKKSWESIEEPKVIEIDGKTVFCLDSYISEEEPLPKNTQENFLFQPATLVSDVVQRVVTTMTSILPIVLAFLFMTQFLKYSLLALKLSYQRYKSYNKETYRKNLVIVSHFKNYRKFMKGIKCWVWLSRWTRAEEVLSVLSTIEESSYLDDLMYQYEVIQLFPKGKEMWKLHKSETIFELIEKIKVLNQNYWSVEF